MTVEELEDYVNEQLEKLSGRIQSLEHELSNLSRKVEYDCAKDYELRSVQNDLNSLERTVSSLEYRVR